MLMPDACWTCRREIGQYSEEFDDMLKGGYIETEIFGAFDMDGIERGCCRRMIMQHEPLLNKGLNWDIAHYERDLKNANVTEMCKGKEGSLFYKLLSLASLFSAPFSTLPSPLPLPTPFSPSAFSPLRPFLPSPLNSYSFVIEFVRSSQDKCYNGNSLGHGYICRY